MLGDPVSPKQDGSKPGNPLAEGLDGAAGVHGLDNTLDGDDVSS